MPAILPKRKQRATPFKTSALESAPRWHCRRTCRPAGPCGESKKIPERKTAWQSRDCSLIRGALIALATGLHQIITLDRADFEIYRTKTGRRLEILP